ncbi:hypothetical protein EDC96DRAFT_565188 [Choanephora cucurbitarum]|nr:hypothetical protein EDC96DRAFT_565188 [Choanephora cucurbitarum]
MHDIWILVLKEEDKCDVLISETKPTSRFFVATVRSYLIVGPILFHEEPIPLQVTQGFVVLWHARFKVEVKNRYLNALIKDTKKRLWGATRPLEEEQVTVTNVLFCYHEFDYLSSK